MSQAAIESPAFRPEDQPLRAIRLGRDHHAVERRPDGALVLSASEPLEAWPERITEKLLYWAGRTPDRTFIARRGPDRKWIRITYAEALDKVTRLASAFLERGLSPERPIMILSGNGLEHAMIALAALADPTRQRIVEMLASGALSSGEIAGRFKLSPPAISQHLKTLKTAKLVTVRVDAQKRIYALNPEGVAEIGAWVDRIRAFWNPRLDALEAAMKKDSK